MQRTTKLVVHPRQNSETCSRICECVRMDACIHGERGLVHTSAHLPSEACDTSNASARWKRGVRSQQRASYHPLPPNGLEESSREVKSGHSPRFAPYPFMPTGRRGSARGTGSAAPSSTPSEKSRIPARTTACFTFGLLACSRGAISRRFGKVNERSLAGLSGHFFRKSEK